MATTYTTNYHLGKQEDHADKFDMDVITDNADKIDAALTENADDIAENKAALVEIIDGGPKNVLEFSEIGANNSHGSTFASGGVSWTLNADGTVTATRTEPSATDSSCNLRISTGSLYVDSYCNGEYVLSGCPEGGGEDTYSLRALRGDDYRVTDTGEGIVLPDKATSTDIYINMLFDKEFDGTITFKPMICTQAAWNISHTHQPFRPSYQALYEMVLAIQSTT